MKVDIPYDLVSSVVHAIQRMAEVYRNDKGHDDEDIIALHRDADRLDEIAEELEERHRSMTADRASAQDSTGAKP